MSTTPPHLGRGSGSDPEALQDPIEALMRAISVLRYRWLVLVVCTILSVLLGAAS
ncbi:MAG: hypothetical protein ACPHRO_15165 [Nannocystaceae bacterium]